MEKNQLTQKVEMVEMPLQLHAVPEAVRDLKAFLEQVAKVVHSQATLLQQEARPVQQIQVSFQAVEEVEEIADSKVVDLETVDVENHGVRPDRSCDLEQQARPVCEILQEFAIQDQGLAIPRQLRDHNHQENFLKNSETSQSSFQSNRSFLRKPLSRRFHQRQHGTAG